MATSFDKSGNGDKLPSFDKKSGKSKGTTKTTKDERASRRAIADDVRRRQASGERRKSFAIVGVCVLVAVLIVLAAAYRPLKNWWDLRQFNDTDLAEIGAPATVCGKTTTKAASGTQQHVPDGTDVPYTDAPPAFGQHYNAPATMERKLYTADDRPQLETLVHNLEHGYTLLWYDDTVADDPDQMTEIRAIADKLAGTGNFRLKFIAVPWTSSDEDGKKFPDGQHIALTHWAAHDIAEGADKKKSVGVWQYCSDVSGEALSQFMLDWDYTNSPEPGAM